MELKQEIKNYFEKVFSESVEGLWEEKTKLKAKHLEGTVRKSVSISPKHTLFLKQMSKNTKRPISKIIVSMGKVAYELERNFKVQSDVEMKRASYQFFPVDYEVLEKMAKVKNMKVHELVWVGIDRYIKTISK